MAAEISRARLVVIPHSGCGNASDISADNHLQRKRVAILDNAYIRVNHLDKMIWDDVFRMLKPKSRKPVKDFSFKGNCAYGYFEGGYAICGDHEAAALKNEVFAYLARVLFRPIYREGDLCNGKGSWS